MTKRPSIKRSNQQGQLFELIEQVYEAAFDESLWPALGPAIADGFRSPSCALRVRNIQTGEATLLAWTENMIPSQIAQEQYRLYYWWRDIFAHRGLQMRMSHVYLSQELISDHRLVRTELYADWLSRIGVFYMMGAVLPVADGVICLLGVHRDRARGHYDETDRLALSRFLPHLRKALEIRSRLAHLSLEREATLDALKRTRMSTMVVGNEGRLLYANASAEALMGEGDAILVVNGRLVTREQASAGRLAGAIDNALTLATDRSGTPGAALVIGRGDRLPLTALIAPFRPARDGFGAAVPAAIIFVRDPENRTPSRIAIQNLFGLTATEASIAVALAQGISVENIAAVRDVSLNTARTHLKSILTKTGTRRQVELVALILQSIASLDPAGNAFH